MSDTTKQNGMKLFTVAGLEVHSAKELVSMVVAFVSAGLVAYINAAKALIVLNEKIGESQATKQLLAAGVKMHTIKNARYLVRVYDDAVKSGHATEEWFDGVHFTRAREFCEAFSKVGIKKMLAETDIVGNDGMFKDTDGAWVAIGQMAEDGLTKSERILKGQKETATQAAAEEAGEEAAQEDSDTNGASSTGEKSPTNPVAEIEAAAQKLDALLEAFAPKADEVSAEKINALLATVGKVWTDARERLAPKGKAAKAAKAS